MGEPGRKGSLDHFFVLLSSPSMPTVISAAVEMLSTGFTEDKVQLAFPHLAHLLTLNPPQFALARI